MSNFALEKIEAFTGKQQFDKLVVDGVCPFDEFEHNLGKRYKSELVGIYHYMEDVSNQKSVPKNKYHFYDNTKGDYREFEFKSKHLRVYGITRPNGKIIILGGTKANQSKDEREFKKIKKKYLESLDTIKTK